MENNLLPSCNNYLCDLHHEGIGYPCNTGGCNPMYTEGSLRRRSSTVIEAFDVAKNMYNSLSDENKRILSEPYNDRRDNEEE